MNIKFQSDRFSYQVKNYGICLIKESDIKKKYDDSFYFLIKITEKNGNFIKFVYEIRKELKIQSEGMSVEDYYNLELNYRDNGDIESDNKLIKKYIDYKKHIHQKVSKYLKEIYIDIRLVDQIKNIVLANCVLPYKKITYEGIYPISNSFINQPNFRHQYNRFVNIEISAKVKRPDLIRFINENWSEIEENLNYLIPEPNLYITKKDMRIYELRTNQNLIFKKIADKIIEEFEVDDFEAKINEDSVKTAYLRTKKKIDSIFIKRNMK